MTSYSKVFKASHLSILDEVKVIKQQPVILDLPQDKQQAEQLLAAAELGTKQKDLLNLEAETKAMEIINRAEETARELKQEAEVRIEAWWKEQEQRLETVSEEAKQQGYHEGYLIGMEQAKQEIHEQYREKLAQIQQLLNSAYDQKQAIISEAEPFLLELSTAIASQIVRQELETHPDKLIELIKQYILRFKEKESITVCVHPDDFEFIQSQRAHIMAVVNGDTEIKVIPDHTVSPKGCIIRTDYGSVDARIDTQLEEIKKVLLEARGEPERDVIS
ncbi:FliH/SctL family protein [Neobacillus muris]|uniref:FliH/SctL family protein n=1 Tax=Neobacillus muris TaxID=2941334 RepID=UPI00203FED53|nr:FliH/SctL family protein [Neobacillus muris]